MSDHMAVALNAAAAAADLLRVNFLSDAGIVNTQGRDIKTLADVAAQECILGILSPTGLPILAEEGDHLQNMDQDHLVWLVDPLDGTLNFTRNFAMAAVSIALWNCGKPVLGVVHDIFNRHVYHGEVGRGAWLDGNAIKVSSVADVSQAVLATGFPSGRAYDNASLLRFVHSVREYKKVRMLGSAAMMLAQVAAGRFDVYEEEDIYIWDIAAGLALIQAAGGCFEMAVGSGPYKFKVRAANGHLR